MNDNIICFLFKKTPANFSVSLPDNILDYIKNKRGENCNDSLFAWQLLNDFSCVDLNNVTFLKSGKPVIKGLSFSLSHSAGYVAIAYTKANIKLGIDVEKITDKNLKFLTKLSKKFNATNKNNLFNLWTEHESTIKALNLNILKDFNNEFKGITKTINTADGDFSLSIYKDSNLEIKEIDYENNV